MSNAPRFEADAIARMFSLRRAILGSLGSPGSPAGTGAFVGDCGQSTCDLRIGESEIHVRSVMVPAMGARHLDFPRAELSTTVTLVEL